MKSIFKTNFILSICFVSLIMFVCIISSCVSTSNNQTKVKKEYGDTYNTKLITLTINEESHEFVSYNLSKYENGIAHWPGCKYCKQNNN